MDRLADIPSYIFPNEGDRWVNVGGPNWFSKASSSGDCVIDNAIVEEKSPDEIFVETVIDNLSSNEKYSEATEASFSDSSEIIHERNGCVGKITTRNILAVALLAAGTLTLLLTFLVIAPSKKDSAQTSLQSSTPAPSNSSTLTNVFLPTSNPTGQPTTSDLASSRTTSAPTSKLTAEGDLPSSRTSSPPTLNPTKSPSHQLTIKPTTSPTKAPTTPGPTKTPTIKPTASPTKAPTPKPSQSPTKTPTTPVPILAPTPAPVQPTPVPSKAPIASSPNTLPALVYAGNNGVPASAFPLKVCEGDCDSDGDCEGQLVCMPRNGGESVPGCNGFDGGNSDYCINLDHPEPSPAQPTKPPTNPPPTPVPSKAPIASSPNTLPALVYAGNNGVPASAFPLKVCEGDCDSDGDCEGQLVCMPRNGGESVPGCNGFDGGNSDYCINLDHPEPSPAQPTKQPTKLPYVPGKLTVRSNGLLLSQGLQSRIIARTGQPVVLTGLGKDKNGNYPTSRAFHDEPDGAAVFDWKDDGWVYVTNSEVLAHGGGGVSALYFNRDGLVVDYKRLLTGSTHNCGGGKTPWNTWGKTTYISRGFVPTCTEDCFYSPIPFVLTFDLQLLAKSPGMGIYTRWIRRENGVPKR